MNSQAPQRKPSLLDTTALVLSSIGAILILDGFLYQSDVAFVTGIPTFLLGLVFWLLYRRKKRKGV